MDVVNKIAETATDYGDRPLEEQRMAEVTVETFGEVYPEPVSYTHLDVYKRQVRTLEELGFRSAIIEAMKVCEEISKSL